MNLDLEILNAASDDWESLDQLFLSVRLEFDSDSYNQADTASARWKERDPTILLSEMAKVIKRLVKNEELQARREDRSVAYECSGDDVLAGWFHISLKGRARIEREWIE